MITIRLSGGLGNQMFQYAAGKRLAVKHKTNVKLDTSLYKSEQKGITPRKFELDRFNIKAKIVQDNLFNKSIIKIFELRKKYIKEKYYHFDQSILSLPNNVYLDGFWQSEKYFKDISDIVREEYSLNNPLGSKNDKILNLIKNDESVSIHIRRGDYVSDLKTKQHHETYDLNYYFQGIKTIVKYSKNPSFYIFSDDINWVKKNFKTNYPIYYIDFNQGSQGYKDMYLMSHCKHNIIANSSFSWWGAWLNKNSNKIVIAPQKWFNDLNKNTKDLIPETWIKL